MTMYISGEFERLVVDGSSTPKWTGKVSSRVKTTQRSIVCVLQLVQHSASMAGGIATPQQLWDLQENAPVNMDSVVIGRALYENRFPC